MNLCIDHDSSLQPYHLLSLESEELLNECSKTWRLSGPFRATLYLNAIKSRIGDGSVDMEEIKEGLKLLEKVCKEHPINSWMETDVSYINHQQVNLCLTDSPV